MNDFDITTIGPDSASATNFWAICVNFTLNGARGCHIPVKQGDDVLWAYANKATTKFYLNLTGPTTATLGIRTPFHVTDGLTKLPVQGARVYIDGASPSAPSDSGGNVDIIFNKLGSQGLKAEKPDDSIRSNKWPVNVRPKGAAKL